MKTSFTKRFCAYFIDVLIVLVISSFITGFIPISEKAQSISDNIIDLTTGVSEKEVSIEEYNEELQNLNYELIKETVIINLVDIVVYLLYFVVYTVYNNGQTVGKRILKLKIVNKNNTEASMNNLLIRAFILYGLAINMITLLLILILNKNSFIVINNVLNSIHYIIFVVIILMVILKKSGRGLHDILSNTIVINEEEK